MKRRDFLRVSAGALASGALASSALGSGRSGSGLFAGESSAPKWYKGNLHAHSQWSDGKDLPEIVVDAYKNRVYDLFCLSDHNLIQR